jgi:hypothetical protein
MPPAKGRPSLLPDPRIAGIPQMLQGCYRRSEIEFDGEGKDQGIPRLDEPKDLGQSPRSVVAGELSRDLIEVHVAHVGSAATVAF